MLNSNTWNRLTMCKQKSSNSVEIITNKQFAYKSYMCACVCVCV